MKTLSDLEDRLHWILNEEYSASQLINWLEIKAGAKADEIDFLIDEMMREATVEETIESLSAYLK